METATEKMAETRIGLPPTSLAYIRAVASETASVLEQLAGAYGDLLDEGAAAFGVPVFELHISIAWDFTPRPEHPVGRPAYGEAISERPPAGRLPPIDLSQLPSIDGERDRAECHRVIEGLIRDGRAEEIARFAALTTASHLTLELYGDRPEWVGLPVEVDTHGRRYAIRMDLRDWLDRHIPHPESAAVEAAAAAGDPWNVLGSGLRESAVGIIASGFVVGFGHAAPDDFPAFLGEPLLELLDDEIPALPKPFFMVGEKKALALVQFGPCVLDGPAERACFTIGASVLVFDEEAEDGAGRSPTREEIPTVVAALRELAREYRPEGRTIVGAPPPAVRRAKGPSLLLDVRARMDPETVKLTSFAVEGTLPRQWRRVRRWEDAERERVEAIVAEHGDRAFEKTDGRPALLTRRRGEIVLGPRERNLLESEIGTRGGFVRTDSDGEWLVRALRVGAGFVTVGISWFRTAERLSSERREEWAKDLRSRLAEWGGQRRLAFDELSDDEKEKIERVLEHIGTLEDARRVLDLVLRRAFATGASVVDLPAHELRILLECDGPGRDGGEGRGNERVRRALAALEELSFKVVHKAIKGTPSAKFQGRFVAAHYYFAAGEGARSDGVFVIELASAVPGVADLLGVMSRGKTSLGRASATAALASSTRPAATERAVELLTGTTPDDAPRLRQRRKKGDRPAKALSTVGPYRKRAVCRSIHEERAFDFIEGNLTTSLAPDLLGRRKRARKDAGTADGLRVYTREWCPLLGDGEWVGALGTHRRSPETGWTLAGRGSFATKTGGGRPAGLVDHVGRHLPSGSAHAERRRVCLSTLDDFVAVLTPFGGVLVGVRERGGAIRRPAEWEWVDLEEARGLDVKDLLAIRWYPFLPADWTRRADELVEERQAERVARGEGERPVFVTRNPGDYLAAAESLGVRWHHRPGEIETLETWPADGRERPAPDVRPLGERLAGMIEASGLKKGDVAKAFGISPASLSRWLRPLAERDEHKGSGVPEALAGLVERWVDGGPLPTPEELDAVSHRRGRKPL